MKSKAKPERKKGAAVRVQRVVRAQMKIYTDGTASFHVRGYDFRFADLQVAINGYLFAPMRPNDSAQTRQEEKLWSKTQNEIPPLADAPCSPISCGVYARDGETWTVAQNGHKELYVVTDLGWHDVKDFEQEVPGQWVKIHKCQWGGCECWANVQEEPRR